MMILPRDVHAESNDLYESVPRRLPLQHATAWWLAASPILGTNSHFEIGKTLYKVMILSRSLVVQKRSSRRVPFTSLFLLRSQHSPFMWSIWLVLAQINCKTWSQSQVSSFGCETVQCNSLDDLCSSAFRQQCSNFVNQCVARFYLLISEVVVGTVSGQSLKLSLFFFFGTCAQSCRSVRSGEKKEK